MYVECTVYKLTIMKKLFNILIIFFIFSSNVFAADEIEKGKTLLKSLSKKSLTKKETISFLKEYAVIVEDERGDGKVTYIFDDDKYSRYKGTEIISIDAWRFSKLGALRLFNKDIKMTWKIKISDKENLINEIRVLKYSSCPFLISYKDCEYSHRYVNIITDYAVNGDLSRYITKHKQRGPIPENKIWHFFTVFFFFKQFRTHV